MNGASWKSYVTMGDPRGVGPDIILQTRDKAGDAFGPVIFGSRKVFAERAYRLGLSAVMDSLEIEEPPGMPPNPEDDPGRAALSCLEAATDALQRDPSGVLVTGPISKEAMRRAGFAFPGHTEYLAHRAGVRRVHMMMAGPRLKVVLVTIHEPLANVPSLVTYDKVLDTLRVCAQVMRQDFGVNHPKVAVAGLNPHAGEDGLFGTEEQKIIEPAVRKAAQTWTWAEFIGPRPPDTVFFEALEQGYDVIAAMYHDQGLAPVKVLSFHETVNVTLGLPYIRTSPDHGTAFAIAGTGRARPNSFMAAWNLAQRMALGRFGS